MQQLAVDCYSAGVAADESTVRDRLAVFAAKLKAAHRESGIGQVELGRAAGRAQSTVSSWMRGEREPSPQEVFAMERAMHLPSGHLSCWLGYLPADILDEGSRHRCSFENAVRDDPVLDKVHKDALLLMYSSFTWQRINTDES